MKMRVPPLRVQPREGRSVKGIFPMLPLLTAERTNGDSITSGQSPKNGPKLHLGVIESSRHYQALSRPSMTDSRATINGPRRRRKANPERRSVGLLVDQSVPLYMSIKVSLQPCPHWRSIVLRYEQHTMAHALFSCWAKHSLEQSTSQGLREALVFIFPNEHGGSTVLRSHR